MRASSILASSWMLAGLACSLPAAAAIGDNAIGVNAHVPSPAVVDLVADMGARWVRYDNDWVGQGNPCSSSITFMPELDTAVNRAKTRGVNVYLTLAYTPACASTGDTDGNSRNDVPDAAAYAQYVRQAVAHYRALGIRHYGLWNEPDLGRFWEGTAAQYVTEVVAPGIQAIDQGCADAGYGDCLALGPDLAHVGDYDVFLETVLNTMKAGGLSFDIFTHHIYQGFDVQIWDGDSFVNALDDRRFAFTRRSLLDVLKETGFAPGGVPAMEIWLTETGYQCEPATDASEMSKQADYVMRVVDEQLERPWYTTTFFYEILDSKDQLDGFGITRDEGGGSMLLKPAYYALQSRIASEPALQGGSTAQCSDGIDNDQDGLVDAADPGCADGYDDDESDDPPPQAKPQIVALPAPSVALDGQLGEWTAAIFGVITSPDDYVSSTEPPGDAADLSARIASLWTPDHLYLAVEVTDDQHVNDETGDSLWLGDSVQVAFDVARNGGSPYDDTDDFEMGWASTSGGSVGTVWHHPAGLSSTAGTFQVSVSGATATYEIALAPSDLGVSSFADGQVMGFSLLVNDNDGAGRSGYIQWSSGIGQFKAPEEFGELALVSSAPPPDAGTGGSGGAAGGAGGAAGSPGDAGDLPDGSTALPDAGSAGSGASSSGGTSYDPGPADDGCGCRQSAPAPGGLAVLSGAALAAMLLRRRRSRH